MATSQNGYQVLKDGDPRLHTWDLPGADRDFLLVDGAPGFLLAHFATWFDRKIEKIDLSYDDWGWSYRQIAGSSYWSNHASGTAVDLNSLEHPFGKKNTFGWRKRRRIRRQLKRYRGCIRWGGDYRTPDDMHFEINRGPAACRRNAKRLSGTKIGKAVLRANPTQRKYV